MGIPLVALMGKQAPVLDYGQQMAQAQQIQGMKNQNALAPGNLQLQQQQIEGQDLALKQQRQQLADQKVVQDALAQNNGDFEKTLPQLAGKVSLPTYQALQKYHLEHIKALADIDEKELNTQKYHADQLSALGDQASKLSDEDYLNNWSLIADKANSIRPDLKLDPDNPMPRQQFSSNLLGLKTTAQYLDQEKARRETQKATEESAAAAAKLPGEQADSAIKQEELKAMQSGGVNPKIPLEVQEANAWLKAHPNKTLADYQKYKATLVPAFNFNMQMAAGGGLTDATKTALAERFFQTGQLPPIGRGTAGLAQQREIMNLSSQLHPEGNLAGNAAAYKANSGALKQVQEQADKVDAFEKTAGKNLDVFLQQAQKAVDTGIPLLNQPARSASRLLGDKDQTAFETSRQTAVNEIARVLNSANATGVLSDSARHEVGQLIRPDATVGQIMQAAQILKQDMANRHSAYNEQIQEIKGRFGAGNQSQNAPAATKTLSLSAIQKAAKDHGVSVDEARKQAEAAGYSIQ